jgi:NAD(P)H-hydrate epimerase
LVCITADEAEKQALQMELSKKYQLYVIVKGANTCITTPTGETYINTTGNPGMAKGGSGDVLTGIITGLLAQAYSSLEASLMGVYVHGYAGDLARDHIGETGMIATDICDHLPAAFKQLYLPAN